MGSEWPRVVISDVCELIVDCINKTAPVVESSTPFKMIRTPNVKNGVVSTDDCRFVDKETFEKWTRRASVEVGDVLLTREAPLGQVGIVTSEENLFLGQRLMQYRADKEKLDAEFLLYSFLSHDLQHQFSMHEGSGSVVSHIRVGDCLKFELNLPDLKEQKRISGVLGALDKKIQLNRQTNQTLEQMAQALFKSWFVDFDPVIDNALLAGNPIPEPLQARAELRKQQLLQQNPSSETSESEQTAAGADSANNTLDASTTTNEPLASLGPRKPLSPEQAELRAFFPSEFEETDEMGWVPKGWGVKDMTQLVDTISNTYPLKSVAEVVFLNTGDIDAGSFLHSEMSASDSLPGQAKKSIQKDDILYSEIRPKNKRYAYVNFNAEQYVVSTKLMVLRSKGVVDSKFAYFILTQEKTIQDLQSIAENRSGTFPQITFKELSNIKLALPDSNILSRFSELILNDYFEKQFQIQAQNSQLEKLRDTLLPKLISGELRLPEVKAATESLTTADANV